MGFLSDDANKAETEALTMWAKYRWYAAVALTFYIIGALTAQIVHG